MSKNIVWIVVILILVAGGFYFFQNKDVEVTPVEEIIPTEPDNGIGNGAEPLDELLME